MAAYAARAGLRSVGLVDAEADTAHAGRDRRGRRPGRRRAEADDRWELLADAERSLGWRAFSNRANPPIGGDPLAIEGYRTIAYEITEQLRLATRPIW